MQALDAKRLPLGNWVWRANYSNIPQVVEFRTFLKQSCIDTFGIEALTQLKRRLLGLSADVSDRQEEVQRVVAALRITRDQSDPLVFRLRLLPSMSLQTLRTHYKAHAFDKPAGNTEAQSAFDRYLVADLDHRIRRLRIAE